MLTASWLTWQGNGKLRHLSVISERHWVLPTKNLAYVKAAGIALPRSKPTMFTDRQEPWLANKGPLWAHTYLGALADPGYKYIRSLASLCQFSSGAPDAVPGPKGPQGISMWSLVLSGVTVKTCSGWVALMRPKHHRSPVGWHCQTLLTGASLMEGPLWTWPSSVQTLQSCCWCCWGETLTGRWRGGHKQLAPNACCHWMLVLQWWSCWSPAGTQVGRWKRVCGKVKGSHMNKWRRDKWCKLISTEGPALSALKGQAQEFRQGLHG